MNLATVGLLSYGISAIWLVLALVTLIVLLKLYTQTRMSGFLWLLFALVVWPFIARVISIGMPMIAAQRAMPTEQMMLITLSLTAAETAIGGVLLVVGLVVLQRQMTERLAPPASVGYPPVAGMPNYPR